MVSGKNGFATEVEPSSFSAFNEITDLPISTYFLVAKALFVHIGYPKTQLLLLCHNNTGHIYWQKMEEEIYFRLFLP